MSVTIGNCSRNLLAAACLSAGVAFAPHALAQDANQPSEPAIQAPAVDDEKLQSFTVALAEVEKVRQEYGKRLQEAASEEQQQQIRSEAGQRMLQAVEETDGISVDEYNQILETAQSDPALAQKLTDMLGQEGQQEAQ